MRTYLPSGELKNGIDKKHDQMYALLAEGKQKTGRRVEDIFMKGATDQYGDVLAWKKEASERGLEYGDIAKEHKNDPIHGVDEKNVINIRLPVW